MEITGLRKQVADLKQAALERRRIEDGLRRSEEMLRSLADAVPIGLCLLSPAGEPLAANQTLADLLGYGSGEEVIRLAGDGLLPAAEDRNRLLSPDQPQVPLAMELALRGKEGGLRTLLCLGSAPAGADRIAVALVDPAQLGRFRDVVSLDTRAADTGPG